MSPLLRFVASGWPPVAKRAHHSSGTTPALSPRQARRVCGRSAARLGFPTAAAAHFFVTAAADAATAAATAHLRHCRQ